MKNLFLCTKSRSLTYLSKVSNSVYLLESDKKSFNEKIDEIKSNEQVGKIQEILNEATKKENERKEKLTPTKSNLNVLAGRNYLHFEFKTSKDTFDKIKEKKFKMLISLVGFDGTPYESQEDNAASLASTDGGPYIRGTQLKDGSMLVYIESLRYFNESTAAPEGKYKIVKLWDADDENKADLLNVHSQEIEIRYKKKQ
ncbi:hypothetical protein JM47_02660 [Ureaplasma diversum]|uniref:Uncharacterized protein n=1 Tax=Ureaplasma diversum TaxID=42094 RepID=A0A0C5RLB5_9BACT|nr:hypothetical protein [Ureaplasma diversum]AJQ45458.1 hypothetical protein JM47_02660 [Ureaplasma diversum]